MVGKKYFFTTLGFYYDDTTKVDLGIATKTALVTASTQGIGKAITRVLAQEGVNVIICSRNPNHIEKAIEGIQAESTAKVSGHPIDLANSESITSFLTKLKSDSVKIDILVYNTGGPKVGNFAQVSANDWDDAHQKILKSYWLLLQAFLPDMIEQGWGRVVSIASASVKQSANGLFLSNIFRPSVAGLNKSLANEYSDKKITFNTICPSGIYTERIEELLYKKAELSGSDFETEKKKYISQIPAQRFGKPEDVANLVAFLVSNKANFMTGVCLEVDGGKTKSIF